MTATPASRDDAAPILEVTGLDLDFWVDGTWYPAAKNLSYDVKAGEVLAIVGESGSGKSSSSMALLGLTPQNGRVGGSAKLGGRELIGIPEGRLRSIRGKDVAVIFQEPMTALNPVYTIGFQIAESLRTHLDMTPLDAEARAIELLKMVEIPNPEGTIRKYPHQLSGGQRQRAMIAMAISCDPLLLIADEPTTALDVTVQAEILDLLRNLRTRLNSAIILITHDMGVVADLADKVIVMKDGAIVESAIGLRHLHQARPSRTRRSCSPRCRTSASTSTKHPAVKQHDGEAVVCSSSTSSIEYPKHGRVPAFRAVEDFNLTDPPRRGRRAGGRVGLRQDHGRPRMRSGCCRSPRVRWSCRASIWPRRRALGCARSVAASASSSRTRDRR